MLETKTITKIILINENDEILVLHRSFYPEHPEKAHKPDLPGGHVDPGEIEHEAVVREVREETGLMVPAHDALLSYAATQAYGGKNPASITRMLYVAHIQGRPEVTLSYEHEAYFWVPKNDVLGHHPLGKFYADGLAYLLEHQLI